MLANFASMSKVDLLRLFTSFVSQLLIRIFILILHYISSLLFRYVPSGNLLIQVSSQSPLEWHHLVYCKSKYFSTCEHCILIQMLCYTYYTCLCSRENVLYHIVASNFLSFLIMQEIYTAFSEVFLLIYNLDSCKHSSNINRLSLIFCVC